MNIQSDVTTPGSVADMLSLGARRSFLSSSLLGAAGIACSGGALAAAAKADISVTGSYAEAAVKLILLQRRHPNGNANDWQAGLQQQVRDLPRQSADIPGLLARRINRALDHDSPIANAAAAEFDAVDEFLFASHAQLQRFIAGPRFAELTLPRELLDTRACEASAGRLAVLYQHPAPAERPVKIITLPKRASAMDLQQFVDYWIGTHGPLALANPPTRERIWRSEMTPNLGADAVPGYSPARFDGVGCIWFRDEAALKAEFSDSYYARVMAPDETRFTDPAASRVIPAQELVVWWRSLS